MYTFSQELYTVYRLFSQFGELNGHFQGLKNIDIMFYITAYIQYDGY